MSFSTRQVSKGTSLRTALVATFIVGALALPISPSQAQIAGAEVKLALEAVIRLLPTASTSAKATLSAAQPPFFEGPEQRAMKVRRLRLCPRKLTLYVGESFTLVPQPLDQNNDIVQGASLNFEVMDPKLASVSSWGEVSAIAPGQTLIGVSAGIAKATVAVDVREGNRLSLADRREADLEFDAEHSHDCDDPEAAQLTTPESNVAIDYHFVATPPSSPAVPRVYIGTPAENRGKTTQPLKVLARSAVLHRTHSTTTYPLDTTKTPVTAKLNASAQQLPDTGFILDGDGPDPTSTRATFPYNAVGSPRFAASEASQGSAVKTKNLLGSFDYLFSAPVLGEVGRGIGVNLALIYNSRVWTKETGGMTFNYAKGWPAPGLTLGYGRLIDNYDNTGSGNLSGVGQANPPGNYLLIQPDGTRIHMQQSYDSPSGQWFNNSNDGSFIALNPVNGKLRYTDGTLVIYSKAQNNRWLPGSIRTRNGDLITISYRQYQKFENQPNYFPVRWAIDQITDTLGRISTFHYYGDSGYTEDTSGAKPKFALAAVTAPDQAGSTRTLVQLDYQAITLQYDFNIPVDQLNNPASGSQIIVPKRLYYPATGRGYLFQDYSTYGMARRVSVRMNMTGAGATVTDGTEIAYTRYNYTTIDPNDPNNQVGHLNDAPQYTTRSEWWQNKTDNSGNPTTATTDYSFARSSGFDSNSYVTEIDTVTSQNGSVKTVTTSGNDQTYPANYGRLLSVEYKNLSDVSLGKVSYSYLQTASGSYQIDTVTATDETGQSAKTSYDYFSTYDQIQNVNEYGFSSSVQRKTKFFYSADSGLIGQNILYAVTEVDVRDASNNLVAKTINEIDNYAVNALMDYTVQAPSQTHDYTNYGVTGTTRGNVTTVTTSVLPGTGTIVRNFKFDIFGNVVRADVSCCQVKNINFLDGSNNPTTYYSQPLSVTDGTSGVAPYLTTSYQYDFNTGLMTNTTDPNGQQTSFSYDSGWRPLTVNSPSTAFSTTKFDKDANGNDQLAYLQQVTYKEKDTDTSSKTITSKSWFDGAGRALRSGSAAGTAPTSFDAVATVYDSIGRVLKQSNPYTGDSSGNGSPSYWTTNVYDPLSRVTEVDLPDDVPTGQRSRIQTSYSAATVTVTDQVGRKRKSQVDGLGRLVNVTEMNPVTGALDSTNYLTTYTYDTLDNLTGVNQGGQTRTFTYDSLSRVMSQATPERGTVGFTYTDFGAVLKRTDFRNVETHYKYDALNRLTQVWYTGSGGSDDPNGTRPPLPAGIAATLDVTIAFKTATPGNGAVDTIADGAGSESYVYDSLGRTTSKTRTIDNIAYSTQYQYNQINQLTLMIYPSGKRVRENFDSRGRLSGEDQVDSADTVLTSYVSGIGYNVAGQVTGMTSGSGVSEVYTYSNERLQLTRQTASKSGTTLMDLNYSYAATALASGVGTTAGNSGQLMAIGNNPSSQPSTINSQTRTQAFTYDDLGRLTTATGWSTWQRRFAYDRWANRTGVWDATSGGNQIQSVTLAQAGGAPTNRATTITNSGIALTQTYDAAGNLTNDGVHSYQYDGENRIAKVDPGTLNEADYFYDANNWRVKKTTSNNAYTTYCIWEGGQVIAEYSNAPTGASGNSYYLADRLSNRMITDTAGAFKGTQDHLPFGEEGGTSGVSEKHRFTNYERDSESNTDYAMNRQYEIGNGRYKQPDIVGGSIGDPQSLNRYAYSLNDPVNVADPSGLFPDVPDQFNAAYSGPGVYWDGIRLMITEYEMIRSFVASGAGVIAPFGSVAYYGFGGSTFIDINSGWNQYLDFGTGETGWAHNSTTVEAWWAETVGYQELSNGNASEDPYWAEITRITVGALHRLESHPECRKLLSGFFGDAYNTLDKLWTNHKIKSGNLNSPPTPGKIFFGQTQGGTITLDTKYIFQSPQRAASWLGLTPSDAQQHQLLHELGHATEFWPWSHHWTQAASDRYQQQITDACFK